MGRIVFVKPVRNCEQKGAKVSLTTKELRKQIRKELCEALKFIGRAANLLKHEGGYSESIRAAEGLEQVTASMTEYIDTVIAKCK